MAYFLGMLFPLFIINVIAYLFRDVLDRKGWVKKDVYWQTMATTSLASFIGLCIINYL